MKRLLISGLLLFLLLTTSAFAVEEGILWTQTQSTLYFKVDLEGDDSYAFLGFSPGNSGKWIEIPLGKNYHKLANPKGEDNYSYVRIGGKGILTTKCSVGFEYAYLFDNGVMTWLWIR